ncbi:MAG: hypothetical protein R3F46_13060 [bacterium]
MLNFLAGLSDDFRSTMGEYYGLFSLYMMFQFSLGLATLFLSTMLASSIGRSELVPQLRLTRIRPVSVIHAYLHHLAQLLLPPCLAFFLAVAGWMSFSSEQGVLLRGIGILQVLLFILVLAIIQLLTVLIVSLGIGRNVFPAVLVAIPAQFVLTGGVVFLLVAHILAPWLLILLSLSLVVALAAAATYNLNRLWPPQ